MSLRLRVLATALFLVTAPAYADQVPVLEGRAVWHVETLDLSSKQTAALRNPIADIGLFDDGSLLVAVFDKKSHAVLHHLDLEGKEVGAAAWGGRPLRKAMRVSAIDGDRVVVGSGNGELAFVRKTGEAEDLSSFLGMGSSMSEVADGTFVAGGFDDDGTGKDRAVASVLKLDGTGKVLWHWQAAHSRYMSWAVNVLSQRDGRAAAVISTNSNAPDADGRINIAPRPGKTLVCLDQQGHQSGAADLPGKLKVLDMADMGSTIALLAWTEKAQAALLSFDAKTCKATRTAVFPSPLPGVEPEEGRIIQIKEQVVLSLSDSSAYAVETWGSAVTALLDPQGKKAIVLRGDKPRLDMKRDRLYAGQGNSVVEYDWTGIWTTAMGSR